MVFQVFLIAFSGYAIARSVRQYRRKDVSKYWVGVWSALWLVVIGVALMPQATDRIAAFAGVGRGAAQVHGPVKGAVHPDLDLAT